MSSTLTEPDLAAVAAMLVDAPHGDAEELSVEEPDGGTVDTEALRAGITSHILRCRQGLGRAYVYDDSTFLPPATGQVWTRVAFFDSRGARLLLTAWRDKGGGNPYRTMLNQWIWRNTAVKRAVVVWWQNGSTWSSWADC